MKIRNDKILVIKHTLYICFIFPLLFRMTILFYDEYVQCIYIVRANEGCFIQNRVYVLRKYMYVTLHIMQVYAYSPFHSVLRSVPFSVRVLVTPYLVHSNALVCHLILKNGTCFFVQSTKHITFLNDSKNKKW